MKHTCEWQADTFTLRAELDNHTQQLQMHLDDFANAIIYERTYTQEDIGKSINPRLDLGDLFCCLGSGNRSLQTLSTNNQMKEKELNMESIRNAQFVMPYRLGAQISTCNKKSSFAILNGGIIQIKLQIVFPVSIKHIQMKLQLTKIRQMGSTINQDATQKIQQPQANSDQEDNLLQTTQNPQFDSEGEFEGFPQQQQRLEKEEHQKEQSEEQEQKGQESGDEKSFESNEASSPKQIFTLQGTSTPQNESISKSMLMPFELVTINAGQFDISGNRITKVGEDNTWAQLLMTDLIPREQIFRFKMRVLLTKNSYIIIGIVDRIYCKDQDSSFTNGLAAAYMGSDARIFPMKAIDGKGFSEGDIVQTKVDLQKCQVSWYVNGIYQATCYDKMLRDPKYEWAPYIEMFEAGDCVEWIGSV